MNSLANKIVLISISVAILVVATSFYSPAKKVSVTIHFENFVGDELVKLDSVT